MAGNVVDGTELKVSPVGLGCWAIGGEGWGPVDDAASRAAVHAALDAGVTLFDTAPIYGRGHADEVLRDALGPRIREVTVATKVGPRFEGDHPLSDLSPENLRRDVEASLRRLGLDALDLAQVHWPCELGTPLAATMEALVRLRDEGKLRHIGLCNYGPEGLSEAAAHGPVATLQTPLSLARREYEHGLEQAARAHGVAVLAYEPLARGLLSGKFRALPRFGPDDVRRADPRYWAAGFARLAPRVERLRQIATRLGTTPAALAIAWAASRPGVVSALFGAKTAAQVRQNVEAAALLARPGAAAVLDRVGAAFSR